MKFFKYIFMVLLAFGCITHLLSADQIASTTKNTTCTIMNTKHQIIYINGPSSSGKTTLAQLLQQELDPPFLHIGIDRVIGMMPDKLNNWEGGPAPLGFSWKNSTDETGHPVHEIQLGSFARKMSVTLKEIVITLAKLDHYIIIDDVAFGKQDVDKWRSALKDYNVLWIGIHTLLPVLEEREKQRGNRMIGSARAQYYQVHKGVAYDLEFDTNKESLEKIVHVIKEKLCPKNQKQPKELKSSLPTIEEIEAELGENGNDIDDHSL